MYLHDPINVSFGTFLIVEEFNVHHIVLISNPFDGMDHKLIFPEHFFLHVEERNVDGDAFHAERRNDAFS